MRTFIITRYNFFGIHQWEDAPEEVAFLRHRHGHIFYVTVKVEVSHLDREVEFFTLRSDLEDVCTTMQDHLYKDPRKSCETMAEEIGRSLTEKYRVVEVTVSEDNQQDGVVLFD